MKKLFLFFMLLPLVFISCKQELKLAGTGGGEYVIIVPAQGNAHDRQAAQYLADYIGQMTGDELAIIDDSNPETEFEICIGNTNRKDFSVENLLPDGFIIKTIDDKLFIAGGDRKGSIYGVIELLEYWGCRRFSPVEALVPSYDYLSFEAMDIRKEPLNALRIINGHMTQDTEYADWLRISTIQEMSPPGYYVHTFNRLLPRHEYYNEHPEYYAWLDTKYSHDQLCPSNAEVKAIIIDKLREEMAKYPEYDIWSVSQDDNFSYCRCDKCAAIIEEEGSPAGPIIRLVNDIAAVFPDKVISTLAYQFSRPAPIKTKPAENVMVMLCTIELNRSRPIADDSLSQSFVKDIVDWGKICKNIYLWDYTPNFNHSISPFPNLHVFQPNLQFFYENNVRKQFPQSNLTRGLEFSEYRARLLSSLLWDPYIDLEPIKQDFLAKFYGPAAPYIAKYEERMTEELIRSGKILYIYEPPNAHADGFLSAENVTYYNELFDQAEKEVANDPLILNRVKVARLPLQYAMMEIGKNDMFGPRGWYIEDEKGFDLKQGMKDCLESFYSTCTKNEIPTLNERRLTPEIYYQSTLRFIDVQLEGNMAFRKPVMTLPVPAEKYAKGDPQVLTNGVQGAHDFNVHWLGWWGEDAAITLDLEEIQRPETVQIGTLWDGKSWILHPAAVTCLVSADGKNYNSLGRQVVTGEQETEETTRKFLFDVNKMECRYIRFELESYGKLPKWHASEGEPSWFFVDEITVR